MTVRIVVADAANARLFEFEHRHQLQENIPLRAVGELSDPAGHFQDGDRRGAKARHSGVGRERQERAHENQPFARQIAETLMVADQIRHIDQLVLVAPPRFLGALRAALSDSLRQRVSAEIHHDLTHAPERAVREHLLDELAAGRL